MGQKQSKKIKQKTNQEINQETNQETNQTANQETNQETNQTTNQPPPPPKAKPPDFKDNTKIKKPTQKVERYITVNNKNQKDNTNEEKKVMKMFFNQANCVEIKPEKPWNCACVSDLHFTNKNDSYFRGDPKKTIKSVAELIERESLDQLWILGDLFHGSCDSVEYCIEIFDEFAKSNIPIYVIGGNHDRRILSFVKKKLPKNHLVQIIEGYFVKLVNSGKKKKTKTETNEKKKEEKIELAKNEEDQEKAKNEDNENNQEKKTEIEEDPVYGAIVLAHDGGNNYAVQGHEIKPFLRGLRYFYPNYVKQDDFLLIGHTHAFQYSLEEKFCSLGCFNVDFSGWRSFAKISDTEDGKLSLKIIKHSRD
ncbi:component of atp-dependent dsDNA exonuclease [Anaeramoeba ignava]|uniref:Component of atp-dependent dsDNA exonuclease n=1 Tax=Anaeramoeba ignava TaxID=1746090 RepID=A0A9Q0LAF1_ANAIG|nr:component of atp-dependent dsDNA exonuclease [Anaeramoeba ignava]